MQLGEKEKKLPDFPQDSTAVISFLNPQKHT
jgi:hypothetical protein